MPHFSIWSIRLALFHLVVASGLGAILLAAKGLPALLPTGGLAEVALRSHGPQMLFGWTLLLVFGVAFWILPRFLEGPPRGREWPAWLALVAVNAGILATHAGAPPEFTHGLVALGAAGFALHAVPRVRALKRSC